ncbi:MAG: tRNA 2-thiouridine(34) synthase MnmA [Spirochaetes bacterium]|nr:tRNA 2-thiouridine(34) synthase MnmA [Spirochaetota bacterium]
MSGGVDSSVAAMLLADAGHRVIGATMSLWEAPGKGNRPCCGAEEAWGAKAVCDLLGVPHYTFDLRAEFQRSVVEPFIAAYAAGTTPNPCVECNRHMKFSMLSAKARLLGCTHVATGHYARLEAEGGRHRLRTATDPAKDQSYFLWPIPPEELGLTLFPLAALEKVEVRSLALARGLPTAKKTESQDVCFIPGETSAFLESHGVRQAPGEILLEDGSVIGKHEGIHRYTLGQRRGLGIGWATPLYVKALDPGRNRVIVGEEKSLWSRRFSVPRLNLLAPDLWEDSATYLVKVRYRSTGKAGKIRFQGAGVSVELDEEERGITPGQSAVFYRGDTVVAGGEIALG